MEEYNSRIIQAKQAIKQADYIIIGAGAGLSTAAGLLYSGEKFKKDFKEFIEKYHFEDLYSASFYNFKTQEEKWAFFAKMIKLNRYNETPLKLYQELYEIVKNKDRVFDPVLFALQEGNILAGFYFFIDVVTNMIYNTYIIL